MRLAWIICLFTGHPWRREGRDEASVIVCGRCGAISAVAEARERHRRLGRGHGER